MSMVDTDSKSMTGVRVGPRTFVGVMTPSLFNVTLFLHAVGNLVQFNLSIVPTNLLCL
jgi:hypothetical protein